MGSWVTGNSQDPAAKRRRCCRLNGVAHCLRTSGERRLSARGACCPGCPPSIKGWLHLRLYPVPAAAEATTRLGAATARAFSCVANDARLLVATGTAKAATSDAPTRLPRARRPSLLSAARETIVSERPGSVSHVQARRGVRGRAVLRSLLACLSLGSSSSSLPTLLRRVPPAKFHSWALRDFSAARRGRTLLADTAVAPWTPDARRWRAARARMKELPAGQ